MRHIRSTLTDSGASALFVSAALLMIVLVACVLLTNHLVPSYGIRVRPADTHFVMGAYDRSNFHIVSVLPGETPTLYAESAPVEGGIDGFPGLLETWNDGHPSRVTVILVPDEAVPTGTINRLADMVLSRGYNCSISGTPAL